MAFLHVAFSFFTFYPEPQDEEDATVQLSHILLEPGESTVYIGSVMKPGNFRSKVTNTTATLITVIVYSIIFFCMYKIHVKLKKSEKFLSQKTVELQKSLTKVLIFQSINPFMFLIIPTLLLTQASLLKQNFILIGMFLTWIIISGSVSSGFLTIFLIAPYRKKLVSLFLKVIRKPETNSNTIRNTSTIKTRNESTTPAVNN